MYLRKEKNGCIDDVCWHFLEFVNESFKEVEKASNLAVF